MATRPIVTVAAAVIASALVTGCGNESDGPPSATPAPDGMVVTDAVLVTPETGAASLSAVVENTSGREDALVHVSAARGSTKLSVFQDRDVEAHTLAPGQQSVLSGADTFNPVVVRGVKPKETVLITMQFLHAPTAVLEVPAVADGPEHQDVAVYSAPLPTITNGHFVVVPGQRCAFVGYTVDGHGEVQGTNLDRVTVAGPDGQKIDWKHVTATGGPSGFIAVEKPISVEPVVMKRGEICDKPGMGDADYVEASDVEVGQTLQVSVDFPAGVVTAPFRVVAG